LIPTTISVTASSATLVYGQKEALTATVTTPKGDPIPTSADGTLTFYDGTMPLGRPQTLSKNPATATLITTALVVGSHTITARYSGSSSFAPSRSGIEPTSRQSVISIKNPLEPTFGVAADDSGHLFVTQQVKDKDIGRVVEIKPDGSQITVSSEPGPSNYVAVDGSGILYVSQTGPGRVVKIKGAGGQVTRFDGFRLPTGVATNASGDVFIAESGQHRVVELTPDGTRTPFAKDLDGLTLGIAVDDLGDLFYVKGTSSIYEVKPGGRPTTIYDGGPRRTYNTLAADASGDVFVRGDNRVVELKADGTQAIVGSGPDYPYGFAAVNGSGDVFIFDRPKSRIVEVQAGVPVTVTPPT
jgi:sugar lactone lactonase YvrE